MVTANLPMKESQIFNASLFYQSCRLNSRVMRHALAFRSWKHWQSPYFETLRKAQNILVEGQSAHNMRAACWFKWILKAKSTCGILAIGLFFLDPLITVLKAASEQIFSTLKLNRKSHRVFALSEWLDVFQSCACYLFEWLGIAGFWFRL